jgi:uroporphyrinogen decarboxylase
VRFHNEYGTPYLFPPLERKLLSETEECQVVRDECGNTVKIFRDGRGLSMPQWVEYPVRSRQDWETLVRPRFDWRSPERVPQGEALRLYAEKMKARDYPLGIWAASLYGWPRCLMGVERVSTMFYDDPALVHEICEHIAEFAVNLLTPVLGAVQFDFAFIWEDMAGKAGPLCSPATYREFCLEPLKRVTALLHKHGVRHIIVDSDGNNDLLIPLWLEAGVNGLRPFEVAANCDAVAIRRQYGKDLIIQGAIDKRALSKGKEEIDREVLSKVPWLCLQGGYFPQVDHLVPPDVSLENYTYYSRLLRQVVEEPEKFLHEARQRGWTE